MKRDSLIVFILMVTCGLSSGDSAILTPMSGQANDILTDYYFAGFDVVSDGVVGWANSSLQKVSAVGSVIYSCGTPDNYSGWNSFVIEDPSGTSAWVGFTTSGNADDRIYQVDYETGTWTYKATLAGNFDMEFSGGNPYVSGLNSTGLADSTSIWLLDTTGSNDHDKMIELSGYSAGLAVDNNGNVYYASYNAELYMWSGSAIAGALGDGHLTYAEGMKLSDLETGAYDVDVDDAGNIIFCGNGAYSYTAVYDASVAGDYKYDYLSIGSGEYGNWHTYIDSTGDVTADGRYYQADIYCFGIAEVVPEPATLSLLGWGVMLLARQRKR